VVQGLGPQLALQLAQKQARKRGTTLDDLIARWEKRGEKEKNNLSIDERIERIKQFQAASWS